MVDRAFGARVWASDQPPTTFSLTFGPTHHGLEVSLSSNGGMDLMGLGTSLAIRSVRTYIVSAKAAEAKNRASPARHWATRPARARRTASCWTAGRPFPVAHRQGRRRAREGARLPCAPGLRLPSSLPRASVGRGGRARPLTEHPEIARGFTYTHIPYRRRQRSSGTPLAKGTWGLVQNVLVGGMLPRTLKEMMFVAISHDRKCRYCEAAHVACCRMLGVDAATLETLVSRADEVVPERARDVLLFGLKCARAPQSIEEADLAVLRRHGLGEPEIMEVIAMSALAVYANIIADATGMLADEMFSRL